MEFACVGATRVDLVSPFSHVVGCHLDVSLNREPE